MAVEYAANPSLKHYRADGTGAGYVYKDLFGGSFMSTAECCTGGGIPGSTPAEYAENIVLQWKNSSGHNAQLLDSGDWYIGCGVYFTKTGLVYCAMHNTSDGEIKRTECTNYE